MEVKLDLVYASTDRELDEQIQARLADGWLTASEVLTVRLPNLDKEIPTLSTTFRSSREKPTRARPSRAARR
jgi:hypothetical protein